MTDANLYLTYQTEFTFTKPNVQTSALSIDVNLCTQKLIRQTQRHILSPTCTSYSFVKKHDNLECALIGKYPTMHQTSAQAKYTLVCHRIVCMPTDINRAALGYYEHGVAINPM